MQAENSGISFTLTVETFQRILGRALPFSCLLAALPPAGAVVSLILGRERIRTITQFGPLPEIHVPLLDYVTLCMAVLLVIAGFLQLARIRAAAPMAFGLVVAIFFAFHFPMLWDEGMGSGWFSHALGRGFTVTWQMLLCHGQALVCAGMLTYLHVMSKERSSLVITRL